MNTELKKRIEVLEEVLNLGYKASAENINYGFVESVKLMPEVLAELRRLESELAGFGVMMKHRHELLRENTALKDFIKEVSLRPFKDSNVYSLLDTLRQRALSVLETKDE